MPASGPVDCSHRGTTKNRLVVIRLNRIIFGWDGHNGHFGPDVYDGSIDIIDMVKSWIFWPLDIDDAGRHS